MARPRKATNILDAKGAFKKDPQRKRKNEAKPAEGGFRKQAPRGLKANVLKAWREIVSSCPQGVLTKSDEISVEIAAHLLAEFRKAPHEMPTAKLSRLQTILGKLGMDPSGRASTNVPPEPGGKDGEFEEF